MQGKPIVNRHSQIVNPIRALELVPLVLLAAIMFTVTGCRRRNGEPDRTVVVYTCLDQVYSEPILRRFERRSGIRVRCVYDVEAAKTTGLVNRLLARRSRPDCDVLWNNEHLQTRRLAKKGLLAPYISAQARRFPLRFRDEHGYWCGFAARMRVIIYNTTLVGADDAPVGLDDFTLPKWRGKSAMARPYFGTTLTHMAVLYGRMGPDGLLGWLRSARENGLAVCAGNGPVRDMVASGERAFGLTDTDDAYGAILDGKAVKVVIPDRRGGVVLIPNTVAMVACCPHPAEAKKLIDYLLSAEVELDLARGRSAQIPLASDLGDVKTPWDEPMGDRKILDVDIRSTAADIPSVVRILNRAGMDR